MKTHKIKMILILVFSVAHLASITCDTFQVRERIALPATFTRAVFCSSQIVKYKVCDSVHLDGQGLTMRE